MKLTKYNKYKPSGNEWLGDIPLNWDIQRLKDITNLKFSNVDKKTKEGHKEVLLCNYVDVYKNDFIKEGLDFMISTASETEIRRFTLKSGDVIATKDSESFNDIAKPAIVKSVAKNLICGYHLALIRTKENKLNPVYLFRLFQSLNYNHWFTISAKGITRVGLSITSFNDSKTPIPSLSEQATIATFLDHHIATFDKKTSLLEKKIQYYQELRKSLINETVCRGLNKNAKLKDSGIEWIGKIPEHWEVKRLKDIGKGIIGLTYNPTDMVDNEKQGLLVLRSSNIQNGKLELSDNVYINMKIPKLLITRIGDILICSRNGSKALIGKNICIDEISVGKTFGAFMTIFRTKQYRFVSYFFNSQFFDSQSGAFMTSTINQLTNNTLSNMFIALPSSLSEQTTIAKFLDEKTQKIDKIINNIKNQIEKLKELRKTLINDVVTGKIKVV
jgi:type I restriction enzyme, S subunit